MKRIHSFAPLIGRAPRLLILGSMPSEISLTQQRYYANPQNAFWPIMAKLLGFDVEISYEKKLARLTRARIALWDVLQSCQRQGSLDQAIKYEKPNDIGGLLTAHPICAVFLNGGKAAQSFRRHGCAAGLESAVIYALPSTSPANARMGLEEKYIHWEKAWQQVR